MADRKNTLEKDLVACSDLVSQGSVKAVSGLSQMLGQEISVTNLHTRLVPVNETPDIVGGWEELTLGVYLGVSGSANGTCSYFTVRLLPWRWRTCFWVSPRVPPVA